MLIKKFQIFVIVDQKITFMKKCICTFFVNYLKKYNFNPEFQNHFIHP